MNNQPEIQQESEVFYSINDDYTQKLSLEADNSIVPANQILSSTGPPKIEILYEVVIQKLDQDCNITTITHPYTLEVTNVKTSKQWTTLRKYQDFLWLFNALKAAYPGYILPYFPKDSVTKWLQQKLIYFNTKERAMYLVSQQYELRNFLQSITKNEIFGFTQQLRIFLLQKHEDFIDGKRNIDKNIEELNANQNFSFSFSSLIQKGLNLFSNKVVDQRVQWNQQWLQAKNKFQVYSSQLYSLVEKMTLFKRSKEDENFWKGPDTQIDSIQRLKAKVQSSQPFGQILTAEIQVKMLHPLLTQCKKQAQMQQIIDQKENIQKIIKHMVQHQAEENRIGRLMLRKQKFETHFLEGWQKAGTDWLMLSQQLNQRFQNIYQGYSRKMFKIWR